MKLTSLLLIASSVMLGTTNVFSESTTSENKPSEELSVLIVQTEEKKIEGENQQTLDVNILIINEEINKIEEDLKQAPKEDLEKVQVKSEEKIDDLKIELETLKENAHTESQEKKIDDLQDHLDKIKEGFFGLADKVKDKFLETRDSLKEKWDEMNLKEKWGSKWDEMKRDFGRKMKETGENLEKDGEKNRDEL